MSTSLRIKTPLGFMLAIANDTHLHYLGFCDDGGEASHASPSPILELIENELDAYFKGTLKTFTTPILFQGTDFQKATWAALMNIPYGETISYTQLAQAVERPKAVRAVANANGANRFVIVVPCHRVIYRDGSLGGYTSGLDRKEFLLQLENHGQAPKDPSGNVAPHTDFVRLS